MLCHIATVWKPQSRPRVMHQSWTWSLLDMYVGGEQLHYLTGVNTHLLLLNHSNSRMSDTGTTNDPGANILALSGIFYRTCDRQRPDSSEERIIT